jgi:hypothetical protein
MKTCPLCGAAVRRARLSAYQYDESGLPNILLEGVHRVTCDGCGELDGVEIPDLKKLHRAIAHVLVHTPKRLTGAEIRFLRSHLGWSGKTFAAKQSAAPRREPGPWQWSGCTHITEGSYAQGYYSCHSCEHGWGVCSTCGDDHLNAWLLAVGVHPELCGPGPDSEYENPCTAQDAQKDKR